MLSLECEGIISSRQLQRLEDLNDKTFLSVFKLVDLAIFFDMPIDYLLAINDDSGGVSINSYIDVLQVIITMFDKNLVEFDYKSNSAGFFILKL